jgi:hypothetical protein
MVLFSAAFTTRARRERTACTSQRLRKLLSASNYQHADFGLLVSEHKLLACTLGLYCS